MNRNKQNGITIVLAVVVAMVASVLILITAKITQQNQKFMVHYKQMDKTYRYAETIMNRIAGQISLNPGIISQSGFGSPMTDSAENAVYEVSAAQVPFDGINGYYIVTTSTRTISGHKYSSRLHTYARISNITEYFAAIRGTLTVGFPSDIGQGKVYAYQLNFDTDGNPPPMTQVLRAEFVNSCNWFSIPSLPSSTPNTAITSRVQINSPNADTTLNAPVKVSELLFPQVTSSEMTYYRGLAHVTNTAAPYNGHMICNFGALDPAGVLIMDKGSDGIIDIYPPGYIGKSLNGDDFAGRIDRTGDGNVDGFLSEDNADHVYYCTGTMTLQGRIHGQILFVAEGDIRITGNLYSSNLTADGSASVDCSASSPYLANGLCDNAISLPGAGALNKSSSTAHQAILIAKGNIVIDNTFKPMTWNPDPNDFTVGTNVFFETIQAVVYSPNGYSTATDYNNNANIHAHLGLDFTGSLIMGESPAYYNVFRFKRNYHYMDSLKLKPPPYLPAIIDVYHSAEETISNGL